MKQRKVPMRKCIASRNMIEKSSLVRIVRTPENDIVIDPSGKKSGRGSYISPNLEAVAHIQKKKTLEKTLKAKIQPDFYKELEAYVQQVNNDE